MLPNGFVSVRHYDLDAVGLEGCETIIGIGIASRHILNSANG